MFISTCEAVVCDDGPYLAYCRWGTDDATHGAWAEIGTNFSPGCVEFCEEGTWRMAFRSRYVGEEAFERLGGSTNAYQEN